MLNIRQNEENGIQVGDTVEITFYTYYLVKNIVKKYNVYAKQQGYPTIFTTGSFNPVINCQVTALMPSSLGKFNEYSAYYSIIMELEPFFAFMSENNRWVDPVLTGNI